VRGSRRPRAQTDFWNPTAASNDEGDLLTGTTFIQRLNTQGGTQPPNAECQAQTAGKVKEVPYKADYIFFK
jgi:hypothetical protein